MDNTAKIDELLKKPCYLIDIFPRTAPRTPDKRYFSVEEYFQKNRAEWNVKFRDLLLKLYCYYDFLVLVGENAVENPEPGLLAEWIRHCCEGNWRARDYIHILLPACDAMILLNSDDLHMTLYNPDGPLMDLIVQMSSAEGLFVYRASE